MCFLAVTSATKITSSILKLYLYTDSPCIYCHYHLSGIHNTDRTYFILSIFTFRMRVELLGNGKYNIVDEVRLTFPLLNIFEQRKMSDELQK